MKFKSMVVFILILGLAPAFMLVPAVQARIDTDLMPSLLPPASVNVTDADRGQAVGSVSPGPEDPDGILAAEVWVDDDYNSGNCGGHTWDIDCFNLIQTGIDNVDSGGTVNVAAGIYVENVVINKTVTLAGAGDGSTFVQPALSAPNPAGCSGSICAGASIVFLVQANNVVIHDLAVNGNNPAISSGITCGGVDVDARDGIITDHTVGTFNNTEVYNVTVSDIYLRGMQNSSGTGFSFHDNTIENVQCTTSSIAVFNSGGSGIIANNTVSDVNDAISANYSRGTQFLNNTVTNSSSGVHTDNSGNYSGSVADLIQGNQISNCKAYGYGIFVFTPYLAVSVDQNSVLGCYVGLTAAGQYVAVTPTFTKNTVDGLSSGLVGAYITTEVWGYTSGSVSASFTNNFIKNTSYGVYFLSEASRSLSATLYENSLTGNTYGTVYSGSGTITANASGNWWGSADPATVGATVSGGSIVDYTPWLASGTDMSGGPGFQGNFSTLWVDDDSPQTGTTGRIQEGINLVSGSTVYVAAGTYTEQVTIDKSLDLIGAGEASTTILAPATRTGAVTEGAYVHDYLLAAYATSGTIDVRIEGFTFDLNAQNKSAGTDRLDGVFFRDVKNAAGTMAGLFSSTIHNFAATPAYESWGLAVYGDSFLTVDDNDISDYTRDGLIVVGDGTADPNVAISGNTITGSATGLNGIGIMDGAAATVTGNIVTGNTRSAPWAGVGIGVWSDGLIVTNNQVNGNFYGIDIFSADGTTVSGNTLADNLSRSISLDNADNNTVSGNTVTGPVGGTDDTAIGLANGCTGNMIGGPTPASGNTITMATSGTWTAPPMLYAIWVDGSVGAGSNTIQYNTITGGKRGIQVDGGNTGTTTIANNIISNMPTGPDYPIFGISVNGGSVNITANTLANTVRPIEVWGAANLSITGNTINGSTFAGVNLGSFSGTATVSGNTIHGIVDNNGIWAQTSGGGLGITGNTIYDISATHGNPDYPGRGIQINPSADGVNIDGNELYNITGYAALVIDTGATGAKINNNYIHNNTQGVSVNEQTAQFDGNRIHSNRWGIDLNSAAATFTLLNNSIAGNNTNPADSYGLTVWAGTAIAEYNWWGSACGPSGEGPGTGDAVYGGADYSPWWADAAMTIRASEGAGGELVIPTGATTPEAQAILDCAAGKTAMFESGSYDGGLFLNGNAITVKLNGCTVGAPAPAFTIVGDDEMILGPGTISGGGTGAGILVQGGADNFILKGVEIQNWSSGVSLEGSVLSFKVGENFIHNNTGAGLVVGSGVTLSGIVTIEGNLFKDNGGPGIQHDGGGTLPAAYNSWGDLAGPAGLLGDGVGGNVTYIPWTFAEIFLDMVPDTEAVVRHVVETTSFDVAIKADAAKLYGVVFRFSYDNTKLTLNSTTFSAPWAGRCTVLPLLDPDEIGYFCGLLNEVPPDPEWDADGGTIATLNFTAFSGTPGNGPWTALFDISHAEFDTEASAIGGQKVFINNAGFNAPTIPNRDITDEDDGQVIIERAANYTGLVSLQARLNDDLAVCRVYNQAAKAGAVELANGTSAASGAYTTAHIAPNWLAYGSTYYIVIDRWLFLPTTPKAEASFRHSRLLDTYPLTSLPTVFLLGGDATNDEEIRVNDLSCVGRDFGKTSGFETCGGTGLSDVNQDGRVNIQDLSLVGGNLYKTFSPWTVP